MTPAEYGEHLAKLDKAAGLQLSPWQIEVGARIFAQLPDATEGCAA